jgi:hypothetical protein
VVAVEPTEVLAAVQEVTELAQEHQAEGHLLNLQ